MATNNNNRNYSNFPYGFEQGVIIQDVQVQPTAASNIFWVGNNPVLEYNEKIASNTNKGTYHQPFATVQYASEQCSAENNNIIYVRPGYTETIISAGQIDVAVAGTTIIGLGEGDNRPTLTFTTDTGASCRLVADNCVLKNFIGVAGLDGLTQPFVILGDGCTLDVEFHDGSSTVEAANVIFCDADNNTIKLKHIGFPAGNAGDAAVQLDGSDNVTVDVDFYGKNSTAVVEFIGNACTNITVGGYFYNSGTTDATKDVVDTVTGSTWFADIYDGAAGAQYQGGSATGGVLSAVGGGASTATTVNNIYAGTSRFVSKAYADLTGYDTAAAFTVTGDVKARIYGVIGATPLTSTSGTTTLSVGTTAAATAIIGASTINNTTNFTANAAWVDSSPTVNCEGLASARFVLGGGADIVMTRNVDDITAGALTLYCEWIPLSTGATVVAA